MHLPWLNHAISFIMCFLLEPHQFYFFIFLHWPHFHYPVAQQEKRRTSASYLLSVQATVCKLVQEGVCFDDLCKLRK